MQYPRHIGFIPDGNRTWATRRDLPEAIGYKQGMAAGISVIRYVLHHTPIAAITGRFLSTENVLQRSPESLAQIIDLAMVFFDSIDDDLSATHTNFAWIGNPVGLPAAFIDFLDKKQQKFDFGGKRRVVFAVNYGGQDEIIRATQKAAIDGVDMTKITADELFTYTDMARFPPLDLVVRTKGDHAQRTSGFASWQIGYAELYFTKTLCPDFTSGEFASILQWYDEVSNQRNFGK